MAGFAVTNSGQGIPPEILPHIFDRFYRADTSRTGGEKKGYGLGLSLAKKIVELHGGELTVSSAPLQNTTFRVLLPSFTQNKAKNQN
jgi:signal transduction histidine kinase